MPISKSEQLYCGENEVGLPYTSTGLSVAVTALLVSLYDLSCVFLACLPRYYRLCAQ